MNNFVANNTASIGSSIGLHQLAKGAELTLSGGDKSFMVVIHALVHFVAVGEPTMSPQ